MANLIRFKDLEKPQASRLGDKATFDHKMNCLTCFRWSTCRDPMKSYRYRCTRYNEAVDGPQSIEDLFASANPLVKKSNMMDVDPSEDPAIEQRLEAIIEAAINSNSPIPPDIKLNDHEIPIADNFYQWLMDDRFTGGGMTPFPRQVYVGATLFNDLCVVEGTRIQTNKGLVRIEEICGDYGQNQVSGWKALSRKGFQNITHGGKTSKRKVKCLTISSLGRGITVTPNHRVLVNRDGWKLEWVRAKDVRIGDNLCAPHEESKFSKSYPTLAPYKAFERDRKLNRDGMLKWPKKVTPQICRLIGYLLGDGTLGKYGISFTNKHKKITDDFVQCMKHVTDLEPKYYVNEGKSENGVTTYVASYNSIEIGEWFQHVGVAHSRYENKSIPDWIYKCPKEGVISFLTGILESDGCVSNRSVRLTMTAKDVVMGTALLMQNLGIYGTTKVGVRKKGFRPTFYWGCHNYDGMVLFKSLFGNLISRLAGPSIKPRRQTNVRSQTRPTVLRNCRYVTSLCMERLDYHTPKYINLPSRTESCEFSDVESLISQLKRDKYLKEHTDGALEIKKRGYALLSVTNIEDAGYHTVYDITVPKSESFTANGVMVHNCPRCSDMEWLEHKMKVDTSLSRLEEKLTFLVRGKCPTCNGRKRKFIAQGLVEDYKTLVLIVGQRGTKTSSLLLCETYNLHRYLKSPSPTKLFGVQPTQLIMSTYTATTFQQVRENVWEPYMNIVTGSPWFANYNKFLVKRGQELGEELAVISEIFVRYRHRNLLVAPAGPSKRTMRGRCVTGGTLINTNQGFVYMRDLIKENGYKEVKSLKVDSYKGNKEVSHTYKDKDFVHKIKTRNGYAIAGTAEHPMLTLDKYLNFKWKRLEDIVVGDWILSRSIQNKPMFGNNPITKQKAGWLGYWVANGSADGSVWTSDESIIKRLSRYAQSMHPGIHTQVKYDKNGVGRVYFKNKHKRMDSSFASLHIPEAIRGNSYSKAIPAEVLMAPKEVFHEFLEAYFECDCHINGGKVINGYVESPAEIIVSSSSKKLVDQLHVILLHAYGIIGRKWSSMIAPEDLNTSGKTYNRDLYESHKISITGSDATTFLANFKRAKVQGYADRFNDSRPGDHNDRRNIPYVREVLNSVFNKARITESSGKGIYKSRLIKLITGEVTVNVKRMQPNVVTSSKTRSPMYARPCPEFLLYEDDWDKKLGWLYQIDPTVAKRIEKLLNLKPSFEEVTSVKQYKKKVNVYDITVPDGHAFTANGLVSHNTRFSAFIDEISWLPMNKVNGKESERGNAKETYTALRNSLRTLFSAYDRLLEDGYDDVPKPLMLTASSPATINDWGMKLYRDSKIERSILGLKFPTWEFNPNLKRKDFDAEFRTNPVESARDFGCMPPIGNSTWMTDIETVTKAFADKRRNAYSVETYKRRSKTGKKRTHATVTLKTEKRPAFGCLLTLDVGVINNSLAFAISTVPDDFDLEEYIERVSVDEEGNSTRTEELDADAPTSVPVKVLFVGEIIPYHECTISLTGFYKEVLMQVCNDFEVVGVASDRWQHLNLVQNLESDFGIEYFERRLTWDDFVSLKEAFFDKEISLPRLDTDMEKILSTTLDNYPEMFRQKPMDHLAYQILTVQEAKGNTVIKGDATDDMFRCVALAHSMLQDVDFLNSLIIDHEAEHIEKSALGMKVTLGVSSNHINQVGGVSRHVPKGHESAIAVVRRGR